MMSKKKVEPLLAKWFSYFKGEGLVRASDEKESKLIGESPDLIGDDNLVFPGQKYDKIRVIPSDQSEFSMTAGGTKILRLVTFNKKKLKEIIRKLQEVIKLLEGEVIK